MRRRGYTLVELLVVIGVIAMLAAILAPVYVQAKKSAQRAHCQSNMGQIERAFELYTSDHGGCYPSDFGRSYPDSKNQYLWAGVNWRPLLMKYVPYAGGANSAVRLSVFCCPNDPNPMGVFLGTSYAYSACLYMTPEQVNAVADSNYMRSAYASTNPDLPCATIQAGAVRFPSKKALVTEYWTLHSDNPKVGWYDDPAQTGNDPWSGERNYLFADGHVRFLSTQRIRPADSPTVTRPRSLPDINLTRDGVAGKDVD